MRTSLHWTIAGALLAAGAAHAADSRQPAHRYSIYGSLETATAEKSAASTPMSLDARLTAPSKDVGLQSGGDFVVMAKLAESPLGCGGSDTIFTNGFDP